jgi:hypothetical protein
MKDLDELIYVEQLYKDNATILIEKNMFLKKEEFVFCLSLNLISNDQAIFVK